jgi:monofunctional biosynthetic peptidoglycan transglycosylase
MEEVQTNIMSSDCSEWKQVKLLLPYLGSWIIHHKFITVMLIVVIVTAIEYLSLPSKDEIVRLRRANPRLTALMEQRKEESLDKGKKITFRQQWIPLSQMSDNIKHAVIVSEDGTFYVHEGIDWYEVKESIKKDIQKGKFVRGASTITQQLAKNLFLSTSKDPIRKLKEIIIATMLEDELSKARILELYLNIIEWGEGIFGVEAASLTFFGKHASELTREDAARLAAVLPSPLRHKPNLDSRYVRYRKNIILARLEARGW